MKPRLTEVYGLEEANATSLAQRYKIPLSVADKVNKAHPKNSDALLAIFTTRYRESIEAALKTGAWKSSEDQEQGAHINWMGRFVPWMTQSIGKQIDTFLNKNPSKKKEVIELGTKDYRALLSMLTKWEDEQRDVRRAGETVLELPEGWKWVRLEGKDACDLEGGLMQHCGEAAGTMYSLRDPQSKPHVTADVGEDNGIHHLIQCRGKQNKEPDRKYWPQILELCKKIGISAHQASEVNNGEVGDDEPLGDWLYHKLGG